MKKLYNCEQVASYYDVKIETVWGWIKEKKLPAIKIGKFYRIKECDLIAFEEAGKTVINKD